MEKIMPLELLASIKGATSSKDVEALFDIIKKAVREGRLQEPSEESVQEEKGTEGTGTAGTGSAGKGSAGKGTERAWTTGSGMAVSPEALRSDEVVRATELEREIIKKNFPGEKDGYLVVPRVIED